MSDSRTIWKWPSRATARDASGLWAASWRGPVRGGEVGGSVVVDIGGLVNPKCDFEGKRDWVVLVGQNLQEHCTAILHSTMSLAYRSNGVWKGV
jgi:hypothetical protein